jgi:hypothetical protein
MRRALTLCLALISLTAFAVLALAQSTTKPADPLPSWNEGAAKKAIIDFVARVTRQGPDFVAPAERIATFDNDGTLWSEQPVYFQFQFALDRVKALGPQHPEWKTQEPFKHVLAGDMRSFLAGGEKSVMTVMATAHSGMTTEEFQKIVQDWFASAQHPKTGRPYDQMIYQPMLEVLAHLRLSLREVKCLPGRSQVSTNIEGLGRRCAAGKSGEPHDHRSLSKGFEPRETP